MFTLMTPTLIILAITVGIELVLMALRVVDCYCREQYAGEPFHRDGSVDPLPPSKQAQINALEETYGGHYPNWEPILEEYEEVKDPQSMVTRPRPFPLNWQGVQREKGVVPQKEAANPKPKDSIDRFNLIDEE